MMCHLLSWHPNGYDVSDLVIVVLEKPQVLIGTIYIYPVPQDAQRCSGTVTGVRYCYRAEEWRGWWEETESCSSVWWFWAIVVRGAVLLCGEEWGGGMYWWWLSWGCHQPKLIGESVLYSSVVNDKQIVVVYFSRCWCILANSFAVNLLTVFISCRRLSRWGPLQLATLWEWTTGLTGRNSLTEHSIYCTLCIVFEHSILIIFISTVQVIVGFVFTNEFFSYMWSNCTVCCVC